MGELVIGVDLGGTKIETIVARRSADRSQLDVLSRRRVPTESERGYAAIIDNAARLIEEPARTAGHDPRPVPIGAGMPGGATRRGGLIKNSNTVCLNGRPFRADLEEALGRRMAFDNDANCFALAETLLGAGAAHRDGIVFGVIMGTGVGGGVVVRGEVWGGAQGIAGEWGHHSAFSGPEARPCYCGHRGCLETYVSGPAVERAYEARAGTRLPLARIAELRGQDAHADAVVEEFLDAFGRGIANVIAILDPVA